MAGFYFGHDAAHVFHARGAGFGDDRGNCGAGLGFVHLARQEGFQCGDFGDFGGGGMLLAFGVVCAILESRSSGQGQVVDAAMVDGSAVLMTMFWMLKDVGLFDELAPGSNLLDSGAPFYDAYECSDGKFVSIGSIEPQFYAELIRLLELGDDAAFANQMDTSSWPDLKVRLGDRFKTRTRDEWCELMEMTDVCFAPVLTLTEAAEHPHNVERQTFVEANGKLQPAPAPRFSRTAPVIGSAPAFAGQHSREILDDWGISKDRAVELLESGAVVDT